MNFLSKIGSAPSVFAGGLSTLLPTVPSEFPSDTPSDVINRVGGHGKGFSGPEGVYFWCSSRVFLWFGV